MKNILLLLVVSVSLTYAAPIYISLAGEVFNYQDELGYFNNRGITGNGQEVEYQFTIDLEEPAWIKNFGMEPVPTTGDSEKELFEVEVIRGTSFDGMQTLSGQDVFDYEELKGSFLHEKPDSLEVSMLALDVETMTSYEILFDDIMLLAGTFVPSANPIGCLEQVIQYQEDRTLVSRFDVRVFGLKWSDTYPPPSAKRPPVIKPVPPAPVPPVAVAVSESGTVYYLLSGLLFLSFFAVKKYGFK